MDDIKLLISKTEDLAAMASKKNYPEFSKFLDATRQMMIKNIKSPGCTYYNFGGYEDAERKVVGCFPEGVEPSDELFPISVLKVTPSSSVAKLTHRDYLGALLGLGIARDCIGDIVIDRSSAYVFCLESVKDFITINLEKVGSCTVKTEENSDIALPEKKFEEISGTVASERLDCVLSFFMGTSRGKVEEIIKSGKVMVNYLPKESVSYRLSDGDIVSVRGFGKFIYIGDSGTTKKGRLKIDIKLYK